MKRKKVAKSVLERDTMAVPMGPELDPDDYGIDMIDPDIRSLVASLWQLGYKTVCSCSGHIRDLDPYPWIVVDIDPIKDGEKFVKLATLLAKYSLIKGKDGRLPQVSEVWTLAPRVPIDKLYFTIMPMNTNGSRSLKVLLSLCKETEVLAQFLLDNH